MNMNTHYYHSAGFKVKVTTYTQPSSESDSSSEEVKHSKRRYRKRKMSPEEIRIKELNKKFYPMRKEGFLIDDDWRNFYPWTDHPLKLSDDEALNRIREIAESGLHYNTKVNYIRSGEVARQFLYQNLLYRVDLFGETPWDEQMIKDLKDADICVIL